MNRFVPQIPDLVYMFGVKVFERKLIVAGCLWGGISDDFG